METSNHVSLLIMKHAISRLSIIIIKFVTLCACSDWTLFQDFQENVRLKINYTADQYRIFNPLNDF